MRARQLMRGACATCAGMLLAGCGARAPADVSTPTAGRGAIAAPAARGQGRLLDWPQFGLDPQRSDSSDLATGITAANVGHLRARTVTLAGTVDSSPIYLHGVRIAGGARRNVAVVTTTYGRTIALDADSGAVLWTFTPPGFRSWAGSYQITTASPLADPGRASVYAASPDGLIHKLALASGREQRDGGWPARVTRDARHEKIAAALNIDGPDLLVVTGGYFGDAPPYQGHLALIARASGRLQAVFNTLCASRRRLIAPASCRASGSAIWGRAGAVVEPGGARILIATGNGHWNGSSDLGDSVLELAYPGLALRQSFTPREQQQLSSSDSDLGSSAPALLGGDRVLAAGKDGIMRLLVRSRLDGRPPAGARRGTLGGELQRLQTPGGAALFSAPAVWRQGGRTTVFIADESATAAYVLRGGRLYRAWQNGHAGTSPVLAGGLLYVYDPSGGGIYVYRPGSARAIAKLPGRPGHWNSPIVVDGHVLEPTGDANDHALTGTLEIFSAG